MDNNNNRRPSLPNGEPTMDTGDWRTQLSSASRQRILNKIMETLKKWRMETLKKHLPFSGPDGIEELRRIAAIFEEKIFSGAVNQTDYLRKISMKILTMETKYQNVAGSSSSISVANHGASMDSRHLMDNNNNWRPSLPNEEPTMDTGDWRTQLSSDSRQRILNKIMETLKKHLPCSGHAGIEEFRGIATRFEEKIFSGAVNQTDYLRKISVKMLTLETKSQNAAGSSSSISAANNGASMDSIPTNQGLHLTGSLPTNQTQASQLLLSQTMQNNTASGMTGSTALPSSMPLASSITNNSVTSAVSQNTNIQNVAGMLQDSSGQHGLSSNMFSGSQRQILGRPHVCGMQKKRKKMPVSSKRVSPYPLRSCRNKKQKEVESPVELERVSEYEDARCVICLETPHNAVLLQCSSFSKGCRAYMCDTTARHSNCYKQYRRGRSRCSGGKTLKCPYCRGDVQGVTKPTCARRFMNAKPRFCYVDKCEFSGTCAQLKNHMKTVHPGITPTKLDPWDRHMWEEMESEVEYMEMLNAHQRWETE